MKQMRKTVLYNLVDRNKDKESDTEYWSMQLLIKLGLIPDPNLTKNNEEDDSFKGSMTDKEREKKLK